MITSLYKFTCFKELFKETLYKDNDYLKYFSFTEHVRLLKISFQTLLSSSSGLRTTKQTVLIYVAKLT